MSAAENGNPSRVMIPRTQPPPKGIHPFPGETEERAIVRTFMSILRSKAQWMTSNTTIMDALDTTIRSPPYAAERKRITDINNDMGLWKGVALGMGTFVFLRMSPRWIRTWFNRRTNNNNTSSWSVPLDRNPYSSASTSTNSRFSSVESPLYKNVDEYTSPSFFWRFIKLGMDSFVSLSMAAYGSFYFMNTQDMIQSISKMPLVEGKSLVSELLCEDFIDLYQSIPHQKWENYTNLHRQLETVTGKKTNLMMIQDFVYNCIKRRTYEKQLSIESSSITTTMEGMDEEEKEEGVKEKVGKWLGRSAVEIPYPGVPEDVEVVIDWKDSGNSKTPEEEDFFTEDSSF